MTKLNEIEAKYPKVHKVRLFLSSPGDVEAERQMVPAVVAEINRMLGDQHGFYIEVIDWKTHVAPEIGPRPQEVINRQIGDYDIFVGIMWKRFGTPTGVAEAGTEEEFNIACANWRCFGRPRILFYFSNVRCPVDLSEDEYEQLGKVITFKKRLRQEGLTCEYESPEKFAELLRGHLAEIMKVWFPIKREQPSEGKKANEKNANEKKTRKADFSRYLAHLKEETKYIDIRGLMVGKSKAHRFVIDQLYIPLKSTGPGLLSIKTDRTDRRAKQLYEDILTREAELQEALQEPRLVIKGDPGAGKTTFLRLMVYALCQKWLGEQSTSQNVKILLPEPHPLPVFIRLGRLTDHIREWKDKDPLHSPGQEDSPRWLFHFLEKQSVEYYWELTADDFCRQIETGGSYILLDGLDESPDQTKREHMSSLAANLVKTFRNCKVVLTSRPAALIGLAMPEGFASVEIAPLDEAAMTTFLGHWSAALYPEAPEKACQHQQELSNILQSRPEIRRMASTPVMLTALAVVHWNESRLPEQRAELYESVITWLFRSREMRPGRLRHERCRKLLQKLALAMFNQSGGRERQIGFDDAARILADEFTPAKSRTALEQATYFLRDEIVDSGIIAEREHRLEFWHLSFQEYLAAFEIAGLLDHERVELLFKKERIYSSEWRELVLLLSGILYKQSEKKINHLITSIIKKEAEIKITKGSREEAGIILPRLARRVGLLGGIVHDLSPFNFIPADPAYTEIVQSVMGIFDKTLYKTIPVELRVEVADTLARVGDPRFAADPKCGPMVFIKGGIFWMGAQGKKPRELNFDQDAQDRESPVHEVELSSFSMSKYPVTVGQYQRFIDDGGYEEKRYWKEGGFGEFQKPDKWEEQQQYPSRPVVGVSWYEASAYAHWAGGRLPTEAEWERAARGPGKEYRKYPWGNKEPDKDTANYGGSGLYYVTPVGIFPKDCSPEEVIDMGGNVLEWCRDAFSWTYYQECATLGVVKDPCCLKEGNSRKEEDARVVRGGAYYFVPDYMRCAYRFGYLPDDRVNLFGFRVVRAAQS